MIDLYPSRKFGRPTILDRKDPVVYSEESSQWISPKDIFNFKEKGFLIYQGLFSSKEIQVFNESFKELEENNYYNTGKEFVREPESNETRSIFSIHKFHNCFKKLSEDPRLKEKANTLLGSETYIHQSRINAKPGLKGKDFYWHSDFETWHQEDGMPRMRAISCLITLNTNSAVNGSLMVMPGSHKEFVSCVGATPDENYKSSLKQQLVGTPDDDSLIYLYEKYGIDICECMPGSVIFFDCNLMHGSNSNISPIPRKNIFFVFNSLENTLKEPFGGTQPRPDFIANRNFRLKTLESSYI